MPWYEREPSRYFPVHASSRLPGPYYPVQPGDGLLEIDRQRPEYLREKREILARPGRAAQRLPGAESAIERAAAWLRAQLSAADPELLSPAQLQSADLDSLLLEIQEDLVIMGAARAIEPARARALYLHVCFPSGWSPARMLGKTFAGLHGRVPHVAGFGKPERAAHAAEVFARPQARFVWSLTPEPALDRHPERVPSCTWREARAAFLRVERQLMLPLTAADDSQRLALFLLRTYVYPVSQLTAAERAELCASLSAMPEDMRRYKGMLGFEPRILELLQAGAGEPRASHHT